MRAGTGGRAKAWYLLIRAERSLPLYHDFGGWGGGQGGWGKAVAFEWVGKAVAFESAGLRATWVREFGVVYVYAGNTLIQLCGMNPILRIAATR